MIKSAVARVLDPSDSMCLKVQRPMLYWPAPGEAGLAACGVRVNFAVWTSVSKFRGQACNLRRGVSFGGGRSELEAQSRAILHA